MIESEVSWAAPFLEALDRGSLIFQRCADCGAAVLYPKIACPSCFSERLSWEDASGRGRMCSYTIVRTNTPSAFAEEVPFVVAIVALDEGPQLMARIVEWNADALECDQAVQFVSDDTGRGLATFRPLPLGTA